MLDSGLRSQAPGLRPRHRLGTLVLFAWPGLLGAETAASSLIAPASRGAIVVRAAGYRDSFDDLPARP